MSLITFIFTLFANFFVVKFVITLAFQKKKKKTYYKIKRIEFSYIKIMLLNTSLILFKWVPQKKKKKII